MPLYSLGLDDDPNVNDPNVTLNAVAKSLNKGQKVLMVLVAIDA